MVTEIWSVSDRIFYHFGLSFALLPTYGPRNKNFENMKIRPGDIIILQMCTINDIHMMYVSRDSEHNGQNFLSFWTVFCPFTLLTIPKIKILKK